MLETIIISAIAGSVISVTLLIFKNKILSLLGGKALYRISLLAMLVFILPLNIGELSLPKIPINQTVHTTAFETTKPTADPAETVPQQTTREVPTETPQNVLLRPSNMVKRSTPVTMREIQIAVWLLGCIISLCRYFVSYFRFKKKICDAGTYEKINRIRVIKSPLVSSPLVFGFFKPTLAIPEIEMNENDYRLALKHEMVHYKHHDSWFKLFAVIVNSICWYNPITYFMVNLIGEACEYACDEQVIKEMDMAGKKQYSEMILSMVCQTAPALSSNMVKSKKQLKRRFEMIMKKKKISVCKAVLCTVIMLVLTGGSVALANGVAPFVSALLKDDYVYVSNYGDNDYIRIVPVEKNGVYYLPLREFLNKSNIDNDKIKFENNTITVDIWAPEMTMVSVVSGPDGAREERRDTVPAAYSWSTTCKIDSREVEIGGEKYTLSNAPYIENGITYVPYEYLQNLRLYENKCFHLKTPKQKQTARFTTMMLFGFDSGKAEFYTDYIQLNHQLASNDYESVVDYAYATGNASAKLSKTGYRTEFEASYDYFNINNPNDQGAVSVKLNKVTRIYSKGSDIEGLFTVTKDGKTVYDNEKGRITGLPIAAGEGVLDSGITKIKIGDLQFDVFFNGLDCVSAEYDEKAGELSKMTDLPDTVRKSIVPESVKLNGIQVLRGSKSQSYMRYNTGKKLIDINIELDNYDGTNEAEMEYFTLHTEMNSKITVIDENTISAEMYISDQSVTRLDSFNAIITLSADGSFELKSTDGKYIIRGTYKDYVPQWQWSEEQKNAPIPQVVMIDA